MSAKINKTAKTAKTAKPATAPVGKTSVYAARNYFREVYSKFVDPKNLGELDVLADLWFEGAVRAFSFAAGSVVLHEVIA